MSHKKLVGLVEFSERLGIIQYSFLGLDMRHELLHELDEFDERKRSRDQPEQIGIPYRSDKIILQRLQALLFHRRGRGLLFPSRLSGIGRRFYPY